MPALDTWTQHPLGSGDDNPLGDLADRVGHTWGPWSGLGFTDTEESLEQRSCEVCGHEEIEASDCLGSSLERCRSGVTVS